MRTVLMVVGKTVDKNFIAGIDDYVERIKHYIPFDFIVIPDLKNNKSMSFDMQKEKEGEMLLKEFQPGDVIILLDENGKEFKSREFASWFEKKTHTTNKRLVFVIGGPYGFAEKIYQTASEKISLSKMTFSHQMVRLVFVEQLYRALNILNGGPYHHD